MNDYWKSRTVALLGGASLIGSHLAEALIERGVKDLAVFDDLSVGSYKNVSHLNLTFYKTDLRNYRSVRDLVKDYDVIFHLASQHGGRGYVSGHVTNLWNNLELDTTIFRACADAEVEKVIFSSSACAYPTFYQEYVDANVKLYEDIKMELGSADGPYGTEKLIGEKILDAYVEQGSFAGVSTRSFTVYGPRMNETHAICAFIAKTMIKQEPFEIWGSERGIIRNWTHVEDNVQGALLTAEHMDRGAINIGIEDRLYPEDACEIIWDYVGWRPNEIKYVGDKPTGPVNRVADATKLKALGWKPKWSFEDGLKQTVDWYYATHDEKDVRENFERKLTEI